MLFLILGILLISLVYAEQNQVRGNERVPNSMMIGGDTDEHGCMGPAGYSWNKTENKCVREWESGEQRYQEMHENMIQAGIYTNEQGQELEIQERENNRIELKTKDVEAYTQLNITSEQVQNRTRLKIKLSNGQDTEVKIMPDVASETALQRLRLKICSQENNCSIELKEVGKKEDIQLAYELQAQRHVKILGLFKAKIQVKAQIDAETGEVIQTKKPWWAFLSSDDKNSEEI